MTAFYCIHYSISKLFIDNKKSLKEKEFEFSILNETKDEKKHCIKFLKIFKSFLPIKVAGEVNKKFQRKF